MRSYRLGGFGGTESLAMREEARTEPKPHEIVVRVRAASLNRRDTMILGGTYPLPPRQGIVPLSDGAGDVVAIGDAVTRFAVGDRVTGSYFARWIDGRINAGLIDQLGCTLDGMLTEFAVLDEQWAARLPDHLSWHEAATLTCAGVTAWNAVTRTRIPKPGQWVLTIGSGGVSLFALQFAKLLGCRVVASHRARRRPTGCGRWAPTSLSPAPTYRNGAAGRASRQAESTSSSKPAARPPSRSR